MASLRCTAVLMLSCLLAPAASWASTARQAACTATPYAHLNLSVPSRSLDGGCQWLLGTGAGPLIVDVVMYSGPVSTVHFSLPDPPFGTYLGESWNFPFTGDRINGMDMTVGCTGEGTVVLGTIVLSLDFGVNIPCTQWKVDDVVAVQDCDGNPQPAIAPAFTFSSFTDAYCEACFGYCQGIPPYDLHPENGATNVPTNVEFSWGGPALDPEDEAIQWFIVIGTNADCTNGQLVFVPRETQSVVLDFLEPMTPYYWRAGWEILDVFRCNIAGIFVVESQVHSFATGPGPVAVERTSWGHVKAMYRD